MDNDIAKTKSALEAVGGQVVDKDGETLTFNHSKTLFSGLVATNLELFDKLKDLLEIWQKDEEKQKN